MAYRPLPKPTAQVMRNQYLVDSEMSDIHFSVQSLICAAHTAINMIKKLPEKYDN